VLSVAKPKRFLTFTACVDNPGVVEVTYPGEAYAYRSIYGMIRKLSKAEILALIEEIRTSMLRLDRCKRNNAIEVLDKAGASYFLDPVLKEEAVLRELLAIFLDDRSVMMEI